MSTKPAADYNNFLVAPLLDEEDPNWLQPIELPPATTILTDTEIALIGLSLYAQLPPPALPGIWHATAREESIKGRNRL